MKPVWFPPYARWLARQPEVVAVGVADGVSYLVEHGRGAVLPIVRHRIQTSDHYPDMSEVRVDEEVDGRLFVVRVLTCFVNDDQELVVCVAGDKRNFEAQRGTDWYEAHVPVADEVVKRYLHRGGGT